jgi:hypothetical protein
MDPIITLKGRFKDNYIYTDKDKFECITYGINRPHIDNKLGYYNLKYNPTLQCWTIIQYLII